MFRFRRRVPAGPVIALALAAWSVHAPAQTGGSYPTKPIRFIVTYAPGGGVDIVGRLVAEGLSRNLGRSIVVENRGGAAGNIGTEYAAKAAADGYTLMVTTNSHMINPLIYRNPGYDPKKDFVTVDQFTEAPSVIIVPPQSPYKTLKDLEAAARAQPGTISYASGGNGSPTHIAAEIYRAASGVNLIHVPYKGGGPANQDVVAAQIACGMGALPGVMHFIKAGRLRALAATSPKRSAIIPDVPTLVELGYPSAIHITWIGALAPSGTPASIVTMLNREILKVLASPDIGEKIAATGAETVRKSPAEFQAMLNAEYEATRKIVAQIGLKVD